MAPFPSCPGVPCFPLFVLKGSESFKVNQPKKSVFSLPRTVFFGPVCKNSQKLPMNLWLLSPVAQWVASCFPLFVLKGSESFTVNQKRMPMRFFPMEIHWASEWTSLGGFTYQPTKGFHVGISRLLGSQRPPLARPCGERTAAACNWQRRCASGGTAGRRRGSERSHLGAISVLKVS